METHRRTQCRSRVFTLILLSVIMGMIILSNLTFEARYAGSFDLKSYGWPLIWYRCVMLRIVHITVADFTIGWYYSAGRLAANAGKNDRKKMTGRRHPSFFQIE